MTNFLFLVATVVFTVYGQLIIKARALQHTHSTNAETASYLSGMLTDVFVLSGFVAAGLAAICWVLAIRNLPVAVAYPFMALSFVLVPIGSVIFFGEMMTVTRIVAVLLIVVGVVVNAIAT